MIAFRGGQAGGNGGQAPDSETAPQDAVGDAWSGVSEPGADGWCGVRPLDVETVLANLEEFQQTADGWALGLRLDLSQIVIGGIRSKGWTHEQAADELQLSRSQVQAIVNADENLDLDTIARILHAVGIKVRITVDLT